MVKWQDYQNYSTIDLIEIIKMKSNPMNELKAEAAFTAFFFRFTKELTQKCEIICANWRYDTDVALEVSKRTFQRFWKYPCFDATKCKMEDIDKGVLLYLFRIARNALIDYLKELKGIGSSYDGSEKIIWDFPNIEEPEIANLTSEKSHFQIIKEALSTLSEKHKIIFLTYSAYEISGHKLPRQLLKQLRDELKISQQTVRAYKNEAFNKVKEYKRIYEEKEI